MTRPRKEVDDAAFARMVIALTNDALRISRGEEPQSKIKDASREARSLATGLAALRQLIEQQWENDRLNAMANGVMDAFDIVTALSEGTRHPIFDYAKGIQMAGKKVGTVSVKEHIRRHIAVGLYRALGSNGTAIAAVKRSLHVERTTLMRWDNSARGKGDRGPDAFAAQLQAMAQSVNPDALVTAAVHLYGRYFESPTIG